MKTSNKTNADYMLKQALQRTEMPSDELLTKVKYNTINERPAIRAYYRGRKLAVAAVVAVTLLTFSTIAFAANTFGIRDIFVPSPDHVITFENFQGTEEEYKEMSPDGTLDDITVPMGKILLAGFVGSPEYEAAMEWFNSDRSIIHVDGIGSVRWDKESDTFVHAETGEFVAREVWVVDSQETVDYFLSPEDLEDIIIIFQEDLDDIPEVYEWYGASTWAHVDKINEIIERHGLVLYGELFDYYGTNRSWDEFQTSIASNPFIDNSDDSFTLHPGYRWESGTFKFDAQYGDIWFSLRSSRKGVFDTVFISNVDIADFTDEWDYENIHGTRLVLAQSANQSFIMADTDTAFIFVSVHAGTSAAEPADWARAIPEFTRSDLEHFADLIDFEQLR